MEGFPFIYRAGESGIAANSKSFLIRQRGVSVETYHPVLNFFFENKVKQMILQIIVINSRNRMAISTNQVFEPTD